jgi:hypothetical protein
LVKGEAFIASDGWSKVLHKMGTEMLAGIHPEGTFIPLSPAQLPFALNHGHLAERGNSESHRQMGKLS